LFLCDDEKLYQKLNEQPCCKIHLLKVAKMEPNGNKIWLCNSFKEIKAIFQKLFELIFCTLLLFFMASTVASHTCTFATTPQKHDATQPVFHISIANHSYLIAPHHKWHADAKNRIALVINLRQHKRLFLLASLPYALRFLALPCCFK
jgi:hypothetical protein